MKIEPEPKGSPLKTILGGQRGGNILEFYTEEFKPQAVPAGLFRQHVIQWFFAAKQLRVFEALQISEKPSEEDLATHRLVCSALITFGEFASNFVRQHKEEANLSAVDLSVECIEAETRLLRDNFRMFHDETITDAQAESVLNDAFK
jgi:hypothetical protein